MHNPLEKRLADTRTKEQKIDIAMSAGPPEIAKAARVIDADESGKIEVLRNGTNDFTCMPGHGDTHPAMCASPLWPRASPTRKHAGSASR